jgi:5-methylcytosine-specific restriction endonuclease McrBC regulatory subunit McrC
MKTLCSGKKTIANTAWLGFEKTENPTIEILESTGRPQKTKFEKPQT